MNLYNIEYLHFALNESRGVIENYDIIGEEIFNAISRVKPTLIDSNNGVYVRSIKKLTLKCDCFLKSISMSYYTYNNSSLNTEGKFIPGENNEENLSKDNKLINCRIILYENSNNPQKINKDYFMDAFSHEIGHAYRYYSIISKNNSIIPDSIKKQNYIYSFFKNNNLENSNKKINMFINGIIYLLDKDEMTAFSNETYEQLKQRKDINRFNIQNHFDDFRMYRNLSLLKVYLSYFDSAIKNADRKIIIRNVLNNIYRTNYNGDRGIKLFRQKIAKHIVTLSNQFIKVIEKGLSDFIRESSFYREGFSEKELKNILKNFNTI